MSTMVSSDSVAPTAGRLAAVAVGLGGVSMTFYALNRITLRSPPGSGGRLNIEAFTMLRNQAWLVGGLIALTGILLALSSLAMRRTRTGRAYFAFGACGASIICGAILVL